MDINKYLKVDKAGYKIGPIPQVSSLPGSGKSMLFKKELKKHEDKSEKVNCPHTCGGCTCHIKHPCNHCESSHFTVEHI